MKLHVYLRNLGIASRRKAEELIAEDRVEVDGKPAHIGQIVQGNEQITVDGQIHKAVPLQFDKFSYVLVNKPVDYTSTTVDFFTNEKSVLEVLPYELRKRTQWQIVGRLDKNSEGLLLLTDNGDVSYVLTHPKFQVEKEYEVVVAHDISESDRQKLLHGITSNLGETYKFKSIVSKGNQVYACVLTEGKKREIREALTLLENHVRKLTRTRLGILSLGAIKVGENRELSESEVSQLLDFVKRTRDSVSK